MTRIVHMLRGGQITIPAAFRRQLSLDENSTLSISVDQGELRIRSVQPAREHEGSPWLKDMYDRFAPVRNEAARYSEAEIDTCIDDAVRAVRESRG